jgi:hypothetical protein
MIKSICVNLSGLPYFYQRPNVASTAAMIDSPDMSIIARPFDICVIMINDLFLHV